MRIKMTKVICTIGPKSESEEMLTSLVESGMNVMRLNFSHGDYEEHGSRITRIRNVMKKTGKNIAILLDTKGPEIRTGKLEGGKDVLLETGKEIIPEEPNSYKFESFIFDAFEFFDEMALLRVKREDEFAPVKNADSAGVDCPRTARELYKKFYNLD